MNNDDLGWVMLILFLFGILIGAGGCNHDWRLETIEKGFAEYHQTTGKWQWKEGTVPPAQGRGR